MARMRLPSRRSGRRYTGRRLKCTWCQRVMNTPGLPADKHNPDFCAACVTKLRQINAAAHSRRVVA